jgi:hypothetical protein
MGAVQEQPPWIEVAQATAQDVMRQHITPIKYAELITISKNIKLDGTVPQQEAFKLTVAELYGIITKGATRTKEQLGATMKQFEAALDREILNNIAYNKFKTWVAVTPDPLLP